MIYVISCGISSTSVSEDTKKIIATVPIIAGGKRLLDMFANDSHEQIIIGAHALETVKNIITRSKNQDIAILASGDALFHGIAGTLDKEVDNSEYVVIPNITAFQALCAKLKQNWSGFELFSIHGCNAVVPWRKMLSAKQAIIYCDNKMPAHAVAAKFIEKYPGASARKAVTCTDLGMDNEIIHSGTLKELANLETAGLSILMLKNPVFSTRLPFLSLGLEDSHYEHEKNLITHPETRAVILSKLRLRGGVMWDLGAGSGSVGIEAAGLCKDLNVYALEKSPERVKNIIDNEEAEGLGNHHTVSGNILEKLDSLPDPDIVFIGGGGKDIKGIVNAAFKRLNEKGRIIVSAVTLETVASLNSVLKEKVEEVVSVGISRSKSAGSLTMMKAENQITIFTYIKGEKCKAK